MKNLLPVISTLILLFFSDPDMLSQKRMYYTAESLATGNNRFTVDTSASSLVIEARGALPENRERQGNSTQWWGVAWNFKDSLNYSFIRLQWRNPIFGDISDAPVIDLQLCKLTDGHEQSRIIKSVNAGNGSPHRDWTLALEWNNSGVLDISIGTRSLNHVASVELLSPEDPLCSIISSGSSHLQLRSLVVESAVNTYLKLKSGYDLESISDYCEKGHIFPEGLWQYLDRENDESRARIGGKYTVAIVKDAERYLILYVDGAVTSSHLWTAGMIKGELTPMPFSEHYNLLWYDSSMNPVEDESHATIDREGILTLSFPLHRSTIRFYKTEKRVMP